MEKEYTYVERQSTPYATVTSKKVEKRTYQPKKVWELNLGSFVTSIDPADYTSHTDPEIKKVDPHDYYATSGEATIKARKLERDLFKMAGKTRSFANTLEKEGKDLERLRELENALFKLAGRARKLINTLQKLKGENIWMETTWQDNRLILKAKNPRKFPEEKLRALEENFCYGKRFETKD